MGGGAGFDAFVAGVDYPMFIVTAATCGDRDTVRAGCLVGFTTQCSIDPPRFLVCISTKNRTYDVARTSSHLLVHLLASSQHDLARLFGEVTGDDDDKFLRCSWMAGPHGLPLLTDCPRWFVGEVVHQVDAGDHVAFVLQPSQVSGAQRTTPLTFAAVQHLQAGHDA